MGEPVVGGIYIVASRDFEPRFEDDKPAIELAASTNGVVYVVLTALEDAEAEVKRLRDILDDFSEQASNAVQQSDSGGW